MRFRTSTKFCAQIWESGRIVIYDNVSSAVKSEYVPEDHLQCTASCARWQGENLLLLGGQDGTLIVFDALESKVKSYLKRIHSAAIEDLIVHNDVVLSTGQDGAIHEYHLHNQNKLRWEQAGENRPLYSLEIFGSDSRLLAASISKIKVFDTATRNLLKTVTTQHVSAVRYLVSTADRKLLSCADRHVVVWSKKLRCESTHVLCSTQIVSLHCEGTRVAAVSQSGECVIYDLSQDKSVVLQFSTSEAEPLEIHDARLNDETVCIIYGPTNRPRIETLPVPSRSKVFIRTVEKPSLQPQITGIPTVQYKSQTAKIIGPLNERLEKPSASKEDDEMPFEERLLECESDSGKGDEIEDQPVVNPRTDNMVHLLLQGLQSGDRQMLNAVIFRNDCSVIENTVKRLPITAVALFVKELQNRLHCRPGFVAPTLKWAKSLLIHHSAYLESCPHLLEALLYVLKSRLVNSDRLSEIKSRVDSILTSNRLQREVERPKAECLLVDDDDEDDGQDEVKCNGHAASDSEDSDEGNCIDMDDEDDDPMEL